MSNKPKGDPYMKAKLKSGLGELYQSQTWHVLFRMYNHGVAQRLVKLQAQLTEEETDSARVPPGEEEGRGAAEAEEGLGAGGGGGDVGRAGTDASVEKSLTLFVMSHAFFMEAGTTTSCANDVAQLYAALFCHGDTEVAQAALGLLYASEAAGTSVGGGASRKKFNFGIKVGASAVLSAWVMWDCVVDDSMGKDIWSDPAFKVYRCVW